MEVREENWAIVLGNGLDKEASLIKKGSCKQSLSFSVSEETRYFLESEAKNEYRNLSDQVRLILDQYVKSKIKGNQNV